MDRRAALALALALTAAGCGTARDVQGREAGCASCHGVPTSGAHVAHVEGKLYATGFECSTCHAPEGFVLLTHTVGGATVAFTHAVGGIGSYVAGTQTCNNTYCHGTFPGGVGADPTWTGTVGCLSCHSDPPVTGQHDKHVTGEGIACGTCHEGYATNAVNLLLHVNGAKDVAAPTGWNGASCNNSCHDRGMGNW